MGVSSPLVIPADHRDFASTGLRVASTVRLHRMMTISSSLIRRELGSLPPALHEAESRKISTLFSLVE